MEEQAFKVRNLSVRSGPFSLLKDVSFDIPRGKTVCLVGESGSGKSMTCLAMMRALPSGVVLTSGELSPARDCAMIFQEPMSALNPVFRVGEQISETLRSKSSATAKNHAKELLRKVGLAESTYDLYPHQLSGGMRQRVIIAIALALEPLYLVADEPTTALDVTVQKQILKLLSDLQKETDLGILLVTHDLGVVAEMASEVHVMYAGSIVESGPMSDVIGNPMHPYTQGLVDIFDSMVPLPGQVLEPSQRKNGCDFRNRCRYVREGCEADLSLTQRGRQLVRCVLNRNEGECLKSLD